MSNEFPKFGIPTQQVKRPKKKNLKIIQISLM